MSAPPRERRNYKKGYDVDDARRRREEQSLSLRKNRRECSLQKRRRDAVSAVGGIHSQQVLLQLERLPEYIEGIMVEDRISQTKYTQMLRRLLSVERKPPIKQVVENPRVVPQLVRFLEAHDSPALQFEAAWALTNIASGDSSQTLLLIQHNAVPILVQLMSSPNTDVVEQAIWALGNIAGDNPECRDFVLQNGALQPLLQHLMESSKKSLLRNGTWTLSNFCRGKPQPALEIVAPALTSLRRLVYSTDEEVLADALWALSYLSDGSDVRIQTVIDSGVVRRIVELLLYVEYAVVDLGVPYLRGRMQASVSSGSELVLSFGMLPPLLTMLHSVKKNIRKEACWTISNVTAGTKDQIQAVLDAKLISPLVEILETGDFELKREAAWAISNATTGTPEQIIAIVDHGVIPPLCDLLTVSEPHVVLVTLEALENILRVGEEARHETGENVYAQQVVDAKGINRLVEHHRNVKIYEKVVQILDRFFDTEVDDDEGVLPETDGSRYVFGTGPSTMPSFDFK